MKSKMPRGPIPPQLILDDQEKALLEKFVKSPTTSQQLALRSQIILSASEYRERNAQIARQLGISAQTVKKWRSRWLEKKDRIEGLSLKEIETQIRHTLSDKAGRGAPTKFTAEQVCQIIAVACEPPEQSGRPVTDWTPKELTEEVIKRGIVSDISTTQVSNFLKRGRLKASS